VTDKSIERMLEAVGERARAEDLSPERCRVTREQAIALLAARRSGAPCTRRRWLAAAAAVMILGGAVWTLRESPMQSDSNDPAAAWRLERTLDQRRSGLQARLRQLRREVTVHETSGPLDRRVSGLRGRLDGMLGTVRRELRGIESRDVR
jgi:hypothetical protein